MTLTDLYSRLKSNSHFDTDIFGKSLAYMSHATHICVKELPCPVIGPCERIRHGNVPTYKDASLNELLLSDRQPNAHTFIS